jgi:hypothetical protein
LGVGIYFLLIKPVNEQVKVVDDQLRASLEIVAQEGPTQMAFDAAVSEVSAIQSRLARYENSKMPNLSLAQRDKGMIDLWIEQVEVLGPILERWGSKGGVRLASAVNIPAPPTNPNEIDANVIKIPIGKMEVEGDFSSIIRHMREWNNCPRLVQIDRPSISGTSPLLKASYEVTVYIFPRGAAGPPVQMAGASTGAGTAGTMGAAPPATSAPPSQYGGQSSSQATRPRMGT